MPLKTFTNAKIKVKASEDFFDRANQIQRKKGSEFVLKSEYAELLGKHGTVSETGEKKKISNRREKVELNNSGKPKTCKQTESRNRLKKSKRVKD